jgi:2'-phosphotransferase
MDIRASKYLSYLLRHGAEKSNLDISSSGFVSVNQIIRLPQSRNYKLDEESIRKIVETNDKKRFELCRSENGELLIRACQGHSIRNLDETQMMTEIINANEYPIIVHGTYTKNWERIKIDGLKTMTRNHVHFAVGYPQDKQVISGMRSSCDLFIEIDMHKAIQDGIKFYLSANKVVLSSGINNVISPKYFKAVKNRHGQMIQ